MRRPSLNERWRLTKDWWGLKGGSVMLFGGTRGDGLEHSYDHWVHEELGLDVVADPSMIDDGILAPLDEPSHLNEALAESPPVVTHRVPAPSMAVSVDALDRLYVAVHGQAAEENYLADGLVKDAIRELMNVRSDALMFREDFDRHCAMSSNDDWSRRDVVAVQKAGLEAELVACRRELRRMEKSRDEWRDKAKRIGRL